MILSILLFALGMPEILLIALVVLLIFGGKKIPELMRGLGKGVNEFKKGMGDVENEFNKATTETKKEDEKKA
jgi:sec-independent protein translocase protein TatA